MRIIFRITAAFLIVITVLTATVFGDTMTYVDVPETKWYYGDIVKVSGLTVNEKSLMPGLSSHKFSPETDFSRAEFVKVLYNLSSSVIEASEDGTELIFADVDKDNRYLPVIKWAVVNEIVTGYPDGTFKPNNPVSRQEAAVLIYRILCKLGFDVYLSEDVTEFFDESAVSAWAKEYVDCMKSFGIITGDEKNRFNPKKNLSRAEGAAVICRLYDLLSNDIIK